MEPCQLGEYGQVDVADDPGKLLHDVGDHPQGLLQVLGGGQLPGQRLPHRQGRQDQHAGILGEDHQLGPFLPGLLDIGVHIGDIVKQPGIGLGCHAHRRYLDVGKVNMFQVAAGHHFQVVNHLQQLFRLGFRNNLLSRHAQGKSLHSFPPPIRYSALVRIKPWDRKLGSGVSKTAGTAASTSTWAERVRVGVG